MSPQPAAFASSPHENIAPTEPDLVPGGGQLPDLLGAQLEVLRLEDYLLRRMLLESPSVVQFTFGQSAQAEFTFAGDQRDPFNGVCVINPTGALVFVGFQTGGAIGSPMIVMPGSYLVLPRRYVQLSLAVSQADAVGPTALPVSAIRLRVPPPSPEGGLLGAQVGSANAFNPGSSAVVGIAGVASVIAANPNRKEIIVVNQSAAGWITLALGPVIPAMFAGIPLAPNGGSFTDRTYAGAISMIAAAAGTVVSIAEV